MRLGFLLNPWKTWFSIGLNNSVWGPGHGRIKPRCEGIVALQSSSWCSHERIEVICNSCFCPQVAKQACLSLFDVFHGRPMIFSKFVSLDPTMTPLPLEPLTRKRRMCATPKPSGFGRIFSADGSISKHRQIAGQLFFDKEEVVLACWAGSIVCHCHSNNTLLIWDCPTFRKLAKTN